MMRSLPLLALPALSLVMAGSLEACTACFGRSDSEMAHGMNMGIYTLLAVLGLMLACVSAFFVMIGRRSARVDGDARMDDAESRH